jgi:class 3 adenylate cyclase
MITPAEAAEDDLRTGRPVQCAKCARANRPSARYCDHCGSALGTAPDLTRKIVSVVFGDLVGSTSLQENLDPERAALVMGRYYEAMRATVGEHGGRLEKLVGDGVVAVFGVDRLEEDDALRATRCAASMVTALGAMSDETQRICGIRLHMRVGVHTGELVVGEGQELVGDTMNTAARLEQAAATDEVLIGESTQQLVRHHVVLERITPLALRGKSTPLPAWRLLSPEPGRHPDDVLEAPLIGRAHALEQLLDALGTVVETGQPYLVTVIGTPGTGKSRLLREFIATVANRDQQERVAVVHARCEPRATKCRTMTELLRRTTQVGPETGGEAPVQATSIGTQEPENAPDDIDRLIRDVDPGRPLVLVMDDLHRAEPTLRRLVGDLTRRSGAGPVLVVAAARPQLRNIDESLVTPTADGARLRVIELAALTSDESHRMVCELLGGTVLPTPFVDRLGQTSEGNPLFLTELVRMLVDEQVLVRSTAGWECPDDVVEVSVPPTVHQLVAARLERLSLEERFALECAAVIGEVFTVAALRALIGPRKAADLPGGLRNLLLRELIEPTDADQEYRFRSEAVHDVAYESLLKQTRSDLHQAYSDWLLDGAPDDRQTSAARWHAHQARVYREQLGVDSPSPDS